MWNLLFYCHHEFIMPCKKWIDVWTIMNCLSFVPLTCSEICLFLLLMEREAIIHFFLWLPTLLQLMCQEVNGPPGILCIKQFSIIAAQGNITLFSQKCIEICAFYMSYNVWCKVKCVCGLRCLMIHHIMCMVMVVCIHLTTLKWKYCDIGEIFISGCTGSCQIHLIGKDIMLTKFFITGFKR